MILLGAGASVPFGIPAMKQFVELFKFEIEDNPALKNLYQDIELSLNDSERLIGYKITFDLESLMVVLQDLAAEGDRPISPATFAFILSLISKKNEKVRDYNIKSIRERFVPNAKTFLECLQSYIFKKCSAPIRKGQENNVGYRFLDAFYHVLFATIGHSILDDSEEFVFSTNWDLCLKQWLEYVRIPFEDGTRLDANSKPVLSPSDGWSGNKPLRVIPLHGSFDLVKCQRIFSGKTYTEIQKVSNPEVYFSRPKEILNAFIVYPLEAVGYDQTLKSPYFDMLSLLKKRLESESNVFVVGFSFRDSVIASIFDEAVRKRSEEAREKHLRILLLDHEPMKVIENLNRQGYVNIANIITPVQVSFPDTLNYNPMDEDYLVNMESLARATLQKMDSLRIAYDRNLLSSRLGKYKIKI